MPGHLPTPPTATRRTALGGLVASALVLSGCDRDDLLPPDADASPGPSTPGGDVDPDQALVDGVVGQVSAAWLLVAEARSRPELREHFGPLQRLHAAHLAALEAPPSEPPVATGRTVRYRKVMRAEERLVQRLADAAVEAESGALARLLASMSAAVAQRVFVDTIVQVDGGPP